MFGRGNPNNRNMPPAQPPRRAASDVARIQGGGLVQIIVTSIQPLEYYLFLNDKYVPEVEIESISLSIEAPVGGNASNTIVRATLSRYVKSVTGEMSQQRTELFPSTLEIVALGRRLSVTCTRPDSVDGLWVSLGLTADGTGNELSGLMSLRFLLSEGFLDAKLTWADNGESEDIFPATTPV